MTIKSTFIAIVLGLVAFSAGCAPDRQPELSLPETFDILVIEYGSTTYNKSLSVSSHSPKFDKVWKLIRPACDFTFNPNNLQKIAHVTLVYTDRPSITLSIYDFGHNPAVVSIDDVHYYFAQKCECSGSQDLIRLLMHED